MNRSVCFLSMSAIIAVGLGTLAPNTRAQGPDSPTARKAQTNAVEGNRESTEMWLRQYEKAFAAGDAKQVAMFWSMDAEWSNETGERTSGREALENDFRTFFSENPGARIRTQVDHVQAIAPGVLGIDGQTIVSLPGDTEPSAPVKFTAVAISEGEQWLLSRVRELAVPAPATPRVAMAELEFLVGTWKDDTDEMDVVSSVRWSDGDAFLIRSYTINPIAMNTVAESATANDAEAPATTDVAVVAAGIKGTQVIGFDPTTMQIRSWAFDSDGSFSSGTWTRDGSMWLHRMSQTTFAGSRISAIQVVKVIDNNTLEFSTISQEIDGEPQPTGDAIRVLRQLDSDSPSNNSP